MKEKRKTKRQILHRIVVGCLRETIKNHGPINRQFISSAAKRIVGVLMVREKGKTQR